MVDGDVAGNDLDNGGTVVRGLGSCGMVGNGLCDGGGFGMVLDAGACCVVVSCL